MFRNPKFMTKTKRRNDESDPYKLGKPKAVRYVQHTFSTKVVIDWNNLPKNAVLSKITTEFKCKIDSDWGTTEKCATTFYSCDDQQV